jgi:hypothetical protein
MRCGFTGGIHAELMFELEGDENDILGIGVVDPNWGTMQLDKASKGQIIAHMKHAVSQHPDAVMTLIVNRITGNASLFYSAPVKDPLELFVKGTPYQTGDGQCRRADRAV